MPEMPAFSILPTPALYLRPHLHTSTHVDCTFHTPPTPAPPPFSHLHRVCYGRHHIVPHEPEQTVKQLQLGGARQVRHATRPVRMKRRWHKGKEDGQG